MKRFFLAFYMLLLLFMPLASYADPQEDYEEAYQLYITAGASVAAYHDRIGKIVTHYLEQDGWIIDHYVQAEGHSGARFLIAQKTNSTGGITYIVATVGTETTQDMKLDLKVDKVYFAGTNLDEFAVNAAKKGFSDNEPKVHRGFYEFVQTGPAATLRNSNASALSLLDLLKADDKNQLYLTGHSLGGAAATLSGARLLSMGINPDQIRVITFGAPAVGNAAFAAAYEPTLHLTRVINSGDPVTGALQTLVGGYKQFGREIHWKIPPTIGDPHKMTSYIDAAIKNYYDKRRQAINAGIHPYDPTIKYHDIYNNSYIAPLQNKLPDALQADFPYMQEALWDEYHQTQPPQDTTGEKSFKDWQYQAAAANRHWIIVPEVSAVRLKQEKNTYYITLTQTVYETTTADTVDTATFSTATYNLTPLESFIHVFKDVNFHLNTRLAKK